MDQQYLTGFLQDFSGVFEIDRQGPAMLNVELVVGGEGVGLGFGFYGGGWGRGWEVGWLLLHIINIIEEYGE